MTTIYYAGIGSRKTPPEVLQSMVNMGIYLAGLKFVLRTGGAEGADSAFATGCHEAWGKMQLFLPWKNFRGLTSIYTEAPIEANHVMSGIHPAWKWLKFGTQKLIARNAQQVLGPDLNTPSAFVLCWTPDGCESHLTYNPSKSGGTGSAIALASKRGIPVINMYHDDWRNRLQEIIDDIKVQDQMPNAIPI